MPPLQGVIVPAGAASDEGIVNLSKCINYFITVAQSLYATALAQFPSVFLF